MVEDNRPPWRDMQQTPRNEVLWQELWVGAPLPPWGKGARLPLSGQRRFLLSDHYVGRGHHPDPSWGHPAQDPTADPTSHPVSRRSLDLSHHPLPGRPGRGIRLLGRQAAVVQAAASSLKNRLRLTPSKSCKRDRAQFSPGPIRSLTPAFGLARLAGLQSRRVAPDGVPQKLRKVRAHLAEHVREACVGHIHFTQAFQAFYRWFIEVP